MTDTRLPTLTRQFIIKHNRYMASATNGRLKEMNLAQLLLEKELEKWPEDKGANQTKLL